MIHRLPDVCGAMYSNLHQKVMDSYLLENDGSFVSKTINGAKYWYWVASQISGYRQEVCMGRESHEIKNRIESFQKQQANLAGVLSDRKKLVAMLSVSGATMEKGRSAKIISGLSGAGLFDTGGVLIGSYAFSCYGNMLGVTFSSGLLRTEDMDFSLDRNIQIGVGRKIKDVIAEVDPSFRPCIDLRPFVESFSMESEDKFKIEFLTTRENPSEKNPVLIKGLDLYAQPLDMMDYLIEDTQTAIMLYREGVLVRVPDPARFALHKLAVSTLRPAGDKTKSDKDVAQATALLEVLLEDVPGLVILAVDALNTREDGMVNCVIHGSKRLPNELSAQILEMIKPKEWDVQLGRYV